MNRKEAFEFLELPESASENDIRTRLEDKLHYFNLLSENAPNDFLRKLHLQNIEKVQAIKKILVQTTLSATPTPANYKAPSYQNESRYQQNRQDDFKPPVDHGKKTAGWLVRHTENQPSKTFALYYGKNYIGRNPNLGDSCIVIDDDPFLSRVHALLDVTSSDPLRITISDDASANGGKPSKNGTYINGDSKRIERPERIRENDTIQVGMTKFIVRENSSNLQKIVNEVEETDYMKTVVINLF